MKKSLAIPIILTIVLSFPAVMIMRSINWLAEPASVEAAVVDELILLTFDIAAVVFVLCTVFLVYALFAFRRAPDDMSDGEHFHSNTPLEIAWTVIPLAIVLGLWWLGFQRAADIGYARAEVTEAPANAVHIKVTGQQWAWNYTYEEQGFSNSKLVLPVDRPAYFDIESVDVIHSFWIPEMRLKMDAIPGRTNKLVLTPNVLGEYKVRCAEICGTNHAYMLSDVEVVDAGGFDAFIAANDISNWTAEQRGEKWSKEYACSACHSIDGTVGPPYVGPTWKDLYGNTRKFADGTSAVADEEYIRHSVMKPGDQVVEGYPNAMPTNLAERVSYEQIDDLIAYIKSLDSDGNQ
jgi:cytochrome c oxidase subunit 2